MRRAHICVCVLRLQVAFAGCGCVCVCVLAFVCLFVCLFACLCFFFAPVALAALSRHNLHIDAHEHV